MVGREKEKQGRHGGRVGSEGGQRRQGVRVEEGGNELGAGPEREGQGREGGKGRAGSEGGQRRQGVRGRGRE